MSSTPPHTSWIKIKDFAQDSYSITVENVTARTTVDPTLEIEISEFSETGITLKLPFTSCALGHFLLIKIQNLHYPPSAQQTSPSISVTAKVISCEALNINPKEEKFQTVTVQFYQFDELAWKNLLHNYEVRQKEIQQLFKNLKE